ncbi:MAG: hypothetical protein KatS3mg111_2810 [Pirellulaceae bacterium]|nr:MAG: hypothetical protein KatS3mg111_2810 [Pirellulaceae bacterium]
MRDRFAMLIALDKRLVASPPLAAPPLPHPEQQMPAAGSGGVTGVRFMYL